MVWVEIWNVFQKSWKKVKVNPFTFWSILGTFSTFLKSLKNHLKTLQMRLKTLWSGLHWYLRCFWKAPKVAKIDQKVKVKPFEAFLKGLGSGFSSVIYLAVQKVTQINHFWRFIVFQNRKYCVDKVWFTEQKCHSVFIHHIKQTLRPSLIHDNFHSVTPSLQHTQSTLIWLAFFCVFVST